MCQDNNCEWRIRYFSLLKVYNKNELARKVLDQKKEISRLEEELEKWRTRGSR